MQTAYRQGNIKYLRLGVGVTSPILGRKHDCVYRKTTPSCAQDRALHKLRNPHADHPIHLKNIAVSLYGIMMSIFRV